MTSFPCHSFSEVERRMGLVKLKNGCCVYTNESRLPKGVLGPTGRMAIRARESLMLVESTFCTKGLLTAGFFTGAATTDVSGGGMTCSTVSCAQAPVPNKSIDMKTIYF